MSAYYNEHDPKAAAWLRELIRAGLIAPGVVDERSIEDVTPHELRDFTQCHFFAGIGGWSYALRLAGWPDDQPVWTGSCPCQPFSAAGKGLGTADERHLWPAFHWLIQNGRPAIVFGEQVASRAGRDWLAVVRADLEGMGYAVGAADLCAAGVGAPHIRQRLYFVADARGERHDGQQIQLQQRKPRPAGAETARSGESCQLAESDRRQRDGRAVTASRDERDGQDAGRAQCDSSVTGGGGFGILADADGAAGERRAGGVSGAQAPERCPRLEHGHQPDRSADGGETDELAHTERRAPERRGLHVAAATGSRQGEERQRQWLRADAGAGRDAVDVVNPQLPGLEGHTGDGDDRHQPRRHGAHAAGSVAETGGAGFWSACDWLPCRDGKARPVEPGTFPLAHGIPARVGRLRGYGNAIVPQVAQAFVEAWRAAREPRQGGLF